MNPKLPTASANNIREPLPTNQASFSTDSRSLRIQYIGETAPQEDWLCVATADPVFWLVKAHY